MSDEAEGKVEKLIRASFSTLDPFLALVMKVLKALLTQIIYSGHCKYVFYQT